MCLSEKKKKSVNQICGLKKGGKVESFFFLGGGERGGGEGWGKINLCL